MRQQTTFDDPLSRIEDRSVSACRLEIERFLVDGPIHRFSPAGNKYPTGRILIALATWHILI
jgi:hypothetical protein